MPCMASPHFLFCSWKVWHFRPHPDPCLLTRLPVSSPSHAMRDILFFTFPSLSSMASLASPLLLCPHPSFFPCHTLHLLTSPVLVKYGISSLSPPPVSSPLLLCPHPSSCVLAPPSVSSPLLLCPHPSSCVLTPPPLSSPLLLCPQPVSYTHLTLPTRRTV